MSTPTATTLNFVLSPAATQKVHGALSCLSKFSEFVSLEARRDQLCLSALNSTKSAYGALHLTANRFFESYQFVLAQRSTQSSASQSDDRFTCRLQAKALLTVFRQRDSKDKGSAIEKCEVSVDESPSRPECRLLVRLICNHGVLKTYKLTYEEVDVMHALFDKPAAKNRWRISSAMMKSYLEHFAPKAELLDISSGNERAAFTSFTEKLIDGKEVLKQPLQTSISLDTTDFDEWTVEDGVHVAISLKDFKAITVHADSLQMTMNAYYSTAGRPLQISYGGDGMLCEFTLMTLVDVRASQSFARQKQAIVAPAAGPSTRARESAATPAAQENGSRQPSQQPVNSSAHHDEGSNSDLYRLPTPSPVPVRVPIPAPAPAPPSPPLPPKRETDGRLFLTYQSSSSENDDDDGGDLGLGSEVNWDMSGQMRSTMTVAKDEKREKAKDERRERARRRVMDEEDEEEETQESGIGPTQQRVVVRGLFD